jgi:hypothetical protein
MPDEELDRATPEDLLDRATPGEVLNRATPGEVLKIGVSIGPGSRRPAQPRRRANRDVKKQHEPGAPVTAGAL